MVFPLPQGIIGGTPTEAPVEYPIYNLDELKTAMKTKTGMKTKLDPRFKNIFELAFHGAVHARKKTVTTRSSSEQELNFTFYIMDEQGKLGWLEERHCTETTCMQLIVDLTFEMNAFDMMNLNNITKSIDINDVSFAAGKDAQAFVLKARPVVEVVL